MLKYATKEHLQTLGNNIKTRIYSSSNQMVDHVVQRGTSGNGVGEKYDSGIVKCGGSFSHTFSITDTGGDFYTGENGSTYETFPSNLFVSTPMFCNITHTSGTGTLSLTMAPNAKYYRTQNYYPTRAGSSSSSTGTFQVFAIGMGK